MDTPDGHSMKFNRIPWDSMELHGTPQTLHGVPWNSMELHGIPWGYFTWVQRVFGCLCGCNLHMPLPKMQVLCMDQMNELKWNYVNRK